MTQEQIDKICKDIANLISGTMIGGVETINDYGFKCAKEAFKIATAIKASEIYYDKEQQCNDK
jgi:hypothetical protein